MHTKDILAAALRDAGLPLMAARAAEGYYHDYLSPLPMPEKKLCDELTIAGTPDTVAAKVQRLAEMGINHLHLRFMGEIDGETAHISKDSAELFAKEVMPRFAEATPARQPALVAAL